LYIDNEMTNWKAIGSAIDPPVAGDDLNQIVPGLEKLETAFRPLQDPIPGDALMWTGDEESE